MVNAPKSCVCPFHLQLLTKGEADISECPLLSAQEIESIRGSLVKSDWRENLISKLKDEVSKISFPEIAEGIGAELKDDALILKCLGREFFISSDGNVTTRGHITPWVKILLLYYIKNQREERFIRQVGLFQRIKKRHAQVACFQKGV